MAAKSNLTQYELEEWGGTVRQKIEAEITGETGVMAVIEEDLKTFEDITMHDGTETRDENDLRYRFTDLRELFNTARGPEGLEKWIKNWETKLAKALAEIKAADDKAKVGLDQFKEKAKKIKNVGK